MEVVTHKTALGSKIKYQGMDWKVIEVVMSKNKKNAKLHLTNIKKNGELGKYGLTLHWVGVNVDITKEYGNLDSDDMMFKFKYMHSPKKYILNGNGKNLKIPGEYLQVSKFIKQYDRLKEAHATPITPERSMEVIKLLCEKFNVSFKKGIWSISGRSTRGRGGFKYRNRKRVPYMALPNKMMKEGDHPAGKLRVGLVLHEFAHVLHYNRWKTIKDREPHGKAFVKLLDNIIEYYFNNINP